MARSFLRSRSTAAFATLASLGACSIINSYDDVVPVRAGGGSGATAAEGGSPDMTDGGTANVGATNMGGTAIAQGGEGGDGADPGRRW